MEIDDRPAGDGVVGNVEINAVVCSQPGRAPVDLHHFGEPILDVEPVADLVGLADLQRDAGDDPSEEILRRESEDDRGNARASEQGFELPFGVIDDTQNEQQCDQVNEKRDHLAEEMGDRCLAFFLEVGVPEVAIEQGDDEGGAEKNAAASTWLRHAAFKP